MIVAIDLHRRRSWARSRRATHCFGGLLMALALLVGGGLGLGVEHGSAVSRAFMPTAQQSGSMQRNDGGTADSETGVGQENGATVGDETIDGVRCQQTGDNQGNNAGC